MIALACINIAGSSWLYVIEMVPSWWLHYSGLLAQVDVKNRGYGLGYLLGAFRNHMIGPRRVCVIAKPRLAQTKCLAVVSLNYKVVILHLRVEVYYAC